MPLQLFIEKRVKGTFSLKRQTLPRFEKIHKRKTGVEKNFRNGDQRYFGFKISRNQHLNIFNNQLNSVPLQLFWLPNDSAQWMQPFPAETSKFEAPKLHLCDI